MKARTIAGRLWLALVLLAAPAVAQTVRRDPSRLLVTSAMRELPVRTVGRVQRVPLAAPMPPGAIGYRHQWPAIYWEARLRGDRVVLSFDDPWNAYRLWIDGAHPIDIAPPGRAQIEVNGLGTGRHTLRLETLSENIEHAATFEGFYARAGARLPPPASRPLQIEWVGDSSMAGYGDRSGSTSCTLEAARLATDTQQAYPTLVSKALGADYEVNAISGRGLVRNFDDFDEGQGLPAFYPFTFEDRTVPVNDPGWHPDLYVVRLWADFVTNLKPNEKWPNQMALVVDYAQTMSRFVADLHARSPGAAILVWWIDTARLPDPRGRAVLDGIRNTVVANAHAAGVKTIDFVPFPYADPAPGTACDHHPGLAQHRAMAVAVAASLRGRPDLLPAEKLSPAARPSAAPARP